MCVHRRPTSCAPARSKTGSSAAATSSRPPTPLRRTRLRRWVSAHLTWCIASVWRGCHCTVPRGVPGCPTAPPSALQVPGTHTGHTHRRRPGRCLDLTRRRALRPLLPPLTPAAKDHTLPGPPPSPARPQGARAAAQHAPSQQHSNPTRSAPSQGWDDGSDGGGAEEEGDQNLTSAKRKATGRACAECGATQTPQWREGPTGGPGWAGGGGA